MSTVAKFFGALVLVCGAFVAPAVASAQTSWWCDTQFGSWWGMQGCGPSTGPAGVLVYVQVPSIYSGADRQPADFTVSVSGQNPTPSSFHGSRSGTPVTLGSGSYVVAISGDSHGYTPSYSNGCSGTIAAAGHALCVITMSRSSYTPHPTPYPYPCIPGPYGCTYPGATLSCTPSYQTVSAGSAANFTAVGGSGVYNWTTPSRTYLGVGSVLSVVLPSQGTQTVVVTSGAQSATCTINVVAGAVYPVVSGISGVTPIYGTPVTPVAVSGVPVVTSYTVPALPNTGFAPVDSTSLAFAVVLLLGTGIAVLPYVRKTFAIAFR